MQTYNFSNRRTIITILFIAGFFILPKFAHADSSYTPVYNPTLHVTKKAGAIKIDGDLSDPGWQNAPKAGNFAEHRPGDQTKPPVNTEALITYDDDNLYVAFICYDDPATVRATLSERDRGIWQDDNICFLLDTYGDAAWAYELNVNPYGIQGDHLWSQYGGEDVGYDLIWESAGRITDKGYQVEMSIPFSSLRFPNKHEQVWKIDFWRNHPREVRRQYSWAAYDRDEPCWPCQWGTVTGISGIKPGKGIEIMPTIVGHQSGSLDDNNNFINDDLDGDISLGGKYSITSNTVAEATYNPDFSQVEADPSQIDVNTNFALFYDERRPFFQEGSDLFRTIFTVVYTRSINDPQFAGKLTSRTGRTNIAYLAARDENTPVILPFEESSTYLLVGRSTSNILRTRRTIGENSHIGILATDRRLDGGGSGTLLSADGKFRLTKQYGVEWQLIGTHTEEPDDTTITYDEDDTTFNSMTFDGGRHTAGFDGESFWGRAIYAGFYRETANSYSEIGYLERSPTFRADNGFQPGNNNRRGHFYGQYIFRFENRVLNTVIPSTMIARKYNFSGDVKDEYINIDLSTSFRIAQTDMHTQYSRSREQLAGIDFNNIWSLHNCLHMEINSYLSAGGAINYGHIIARAEDPPVMGKRFNYSAWVDVKPIDRILVENSIVYERCDNLDTDENIYKGYIARTHLSYLVVRRLSLRMILEYNDFNEAFNVDPLITYRLNPFSIFYIGSTHDYERLTADDDTRSWDMTSRQFFVKLQYLFQL